MKCPCCDAEMHNAFSYDSDKEQIEFRHHVLYVCLGSNDLCNGLVIREAKEDNKLTYITPRHSVITLHENYVKNVDKETLLKQIFSPFEWDEYRDSVRPVINNYELWIMENNEPKFLGYASGLDFREAFKRVSETTRIAGSSEYTFNDQYITVVNSQGVELNVYPSKTDLIACHPVMEESTP